VADNFVKFDDVKMRDLTNDAKDYYAGEVAKDIMEIALARTPFDTGYLHDNHKIIRFALGVYLIVADTGYSWFVHQGTSRQRPQPWLTDAVDNYAQRASGRRFVGGVA
jgi:HK97 gp10 family phage protein